MSRQIVATVATLLAIAAPVSAQPAPLEISGGIATQSVEGEYGRWHTSVGWAFDVARPLTDTIAVTVDVSRTGRSNDYANGYGESDSDVIVAVGPRFTTRRERRTIGFAQVLAGVDRNAFTLRTPPYPDYNGVDSAFVADFAAGIDVAVSRRVALRGAGGAAIVKPWYAVAWQLPMWRLRVACVYRLH